MHLRSLSVKMDIVIPISQGYQKPKLSDIHKALEIQEQMQLQKRKRLLSCHVWPGGKIIHLSCQTYLSSYFLLAYLLSPF